MCRGPRTTGEPSATVDMGSSWRCIAYRRPFALGREANGLVPQCAPDAQPSMTTTELSGGQSLVVIEMTAKS
jgi:hypothetical protein